MSEGGATEATDDLVLRVGRLRSFATFRRLLRAAEGVDDVAAEAVRFATAELGFVHVSVYAAERDDEDFRLLASSDDGVVDIPLDRTSTLAARLETESFARGIPELAAFAERESCEIVAIALRGQDKVIGFAIVALREFDAETLAELAFDFESALSARILTKQRAEELAVLEIQERELVGLLRDVQERDAIIRQDLDEARLFQQNMLGAPPRVDNAAIEVVYRPLGLVGGDIYAVSLHDGRLRLFIADATGHGVRASLTTMFIKSGYEAVKAAATGPASLLQLLNDNIARTYRSAEMLFSATCVDLHLATGEVEFASAAHPALCVVHGGEASLVEGGGAFLGLRSHMSFETHRLKLEEGDGLYLLTDGFAETRGGEGGEQFGEERTRVAILEAHLAGKKVGETLADAVTSFAAGNALTDDATFVGVRYGATDEELGPVSRR